jgi:hypothetical protein
MSEWTVDTLKEDMEKSFTALEKLLDRRFVDNDKAIQAALLAAKEAVAAALSAAKEATAEAKIAQDQQLQSHNGLIRKMEIQTNTFLPRAEANISFRAAEDKFAAALKPLSEYITAQQGQSKGADKTWAVVVSIIMVGIAIIGFIGFKL